MVCIWSMMAFCTWYLVYNGELLMVLWLQVGYMAGTLVMRSYNDGTI